MRILVLSQRWYPDTFGGSEHVATEQARRLAERGHKVTFIAERVQKVLPEFIVEDGVRIFRYSSPEFLARLGGASRAALKEIPRVLKKFKAGDFDAVIAHHPFPAYSFFKAHFKVPVLYIFHTAFAREASVEVTGIKRRLPLLLRPLRPLLNKGFFRWAKYVEENALTKACRIAVFSRFSETLLKEFYPHVEHKAALLPIGINLERFFPLEDKAAVRQRLGFSMDYKLLLTVRRFTPRMGVSKLIYAMDLVLKIFPAVKLLIVGEGPLKANLQAEIEARQLKGKVTLVGAVPVEDLPLYYQAADLFVLPTEAFEGLGMATLEALASGLPTVGTPAGATPEVLSKLDASLIAKSIAPEDLADSILGFFARQTEERVSLTKKAREVAEQYYQWDKAIDALEKVLKNL